MSFRTLHKAVTYLAASLGLFGLTLGAGLSAGIMVLCLVAMTASWWAEGDRIHAPSYTRGWTTLVYIVFGFQVVRGFGEASILSLGVEFAAFLQITRLFSRRTARDYQQVVVLAILHLICASVLSTDLDFAVVFVGFLFVTPWMLSLTHLRATVEENYGTLTDNSAVERVLSSRRLAGPSLLFGTAFLSVPLFIATMALFLIFPRVGMGFLTFDQRAGISVAGFGRNVELGRFGVIRDDPTVILRVRIPDLEDEPPERKSLRLRGTAFDEYDGRQWTRSTVEGYRIRPVSNYYPIRPVARMISDYEMEIEVDAMEEPVLFLPPDTVGIEVPARIQAGRERPRVIRWSAGREVRYLDGDALGIRYTALIAANPSLVPHEPLSPEAHARYVSIPEGYERVETLAQEVVGDAGTDEGRAERILRWLRDSGQFTYSLRMPEVGRDQDPLHVFLFDSRYGHCEYFSTALAVMLRSIGVPTRNVTGFVGGRYNRFGEYYAVRNGDAHSWVEVHLGGRWVMMDPTPPARADVGPAEGPLSGLAALLDSLRARWARDVVGYDLNDQASAFRRLIDWASRYGARQSPRPRGARDGRRDEPVSGDDLSAVWGWSIAAVITLMVVAWVWRRRAYFGARLQARRSEPPEVRIFRRMERTLEKAGLGRPASRTPRAHARELEEADFSASEEVTRITQAYLEARFAGRSTGDVEIRRLSDALGQVRSAKLTKAHPSSAEPPGGVV